MDVCSIKNKGFLCGGLCSATGIMQGRLNLGRKKTTTPEHNETNLRYELSYDCVGVNGTVLPPGAHRVFPSPSRLHSQLAGRVFWLSFSSCALLSLLSTFPCSLAFIICPPLGSSHTRSSPIPLSSGSFLCVSGPVLTGLLCLISPAEAGRWVSGDIGCTLEIDE